VPTGVFVAHRRITFAGPGTGECRKPAPLESRVGLKDATSGSRGEWTSQFVQVWTGITEQFGVRFGCLPRISCMFADHCRERTGSALFHDPSNDPDLHIPRTLGTRGMWVRIFVMFSKKSHSELKAGRNPRQRPRTECEVPVCRDMVACVFDKHAMEGSLGVENKMEAAPEDVVSNPTVDTPR
jgi:hypothetical protein